MATVEESQEERLEEKQKKQEAEVFEVWNKTALTKCLKLTIKRKDHLAARFRGNFWRENWRRALEIIAASPFCTGKNERRWIANIDWFIRNDDPVTLALEGKYDAKTKASPNSSITYDSVWNERIDDLIRAHRAGENTELSYVGKQFKRAMEFTSAQSIAAYVEVRIGNVPDSWSQILKAPVPGEGNTRHE